MEQVLLVFTVESPASLAKLGAIAFVTIMSLWHLSLYSVLVSKLLSLFFLLISSHLSYSLLNVYLITLFISCLNYSTNSFFLYPLPLVVLLNSCINYSIVLLSCFTFFNLATFIVLLSSLLSSFFKSIRNFFIIIYSNISASRFSIIFFFQISANPFYI